jgi:hypothetical protein
MLKQSGKIERLLRQLPTSKNIHFAGICCNSTILASCCNDMTKYNPFCPFMLQHAETGVIDKYFKNKYAKMYQYILCGKFKVRDRAKEIIVIKTNSKNELTNSKCCLFCFNIMKCFNIKTIYYSNEKGIIIKEKLTDFVPDYESSGIIYIKELIATNKIKNIGFLTILFRS